MVSIGGETGYRTFTIGPAESGLRKYPLRNHRQADAVPAASDESTRFAAMRVPQAEDHTRNGNQRMTRAFADAANAALRFNADARRFRERA